MSAKKKRGRNHKRNTPNHTHSYLTPILGKMQEGTQNWRILKHLIDHGSITTYEAFTRYRITRLAARMFELRDLGVEFESELVHKKNEDGVSERYAIYRLEDKS